jgi:DNA invertase Pin-like site-specific DNA recombinase
VETYTDHGVSGTKVRRPALHKMMEDARRHKFDVVVVWACGRLAKSTRHLLQVLDELNGFGIQFLSQHEPIDGGSAWPGDPRHRQRNRRTRKVSDRGKSSGRNARATLEGRQIGRARLAINREQVVEDRRSGMSLTVVAKRLAISRARVGGLMKKFNGNSPAEEVLRSGRNAVAQVSL